MKWIFITLVAALFLYEFVALAIKSSGDTISEIVWNVTVSYPLVPFLVGLLCGHFFWQRG